MLQHLLDLFRTDTPLQLERLRAALREGDSQGLAHAAHALKGSAANLGAIHLAALCKEVEDHGESGVVVDQPTLVGVERALDAAVKALETFAVVLRRQP